MNFKRQVMELFANKYFLYVVVVVTALNLLGYLVVNNYNAPIFFALVFIIASNFSKNMAVILLVSLLATNLLTARNIIKEGMQNNTATTTNTTSASPTTDDKIDNIDPSFKKAANALKTSKNVSEAKQKYESKTATTNTDEDEQVIDKPVDPNNMDMNITSSVSSVQPSVSGMTNMKRGKTNSGSRLDYASTLEEAYDNLDKMLGSEGIKQLTTDTKDLMIKQQELFKSMEGMAPLLQNAKSMLDGFDMKNLSGLANLAQSFTTNMPNIKVVQPKS